MVSVHDIKLSERYLLEITQSKSLAEIEELQLNDLNLNNNDLDPIIFNNLINLIEINLSGNNLKFIPKNIFLPKLQYLDISRNSLVDVEWLSRFKNLKEIDIFSNINLTIDDSYKIMFLLKNLQFLDGKRVDNNKIGEQFTTELLKKMNNLWFAKFESSWKSKFSEEEKVSLFKKFVDLSKENLRFGPNSLKGFRKWRIQSIAQDFFNLKKNDPSACFAQLQNSSLAKFTKQETDIIELPKFEWKFEPIIFLQCHSADEDPNDFTSQIWCCEFEPDNSNLIKTTTSVATCGGNSVCIINCETAKVVAKFEYDNEQFYTLSWTNVSINGNQTNLLVAAGCLGYHHLIHVDQSVCYGRIKSHSFPIQTIRFVTPTSTQLLSADKKGNVFLFDIGIPLIPEYKFKWIKLMSFTGLDCAPLRLLIKNNFLFCGSELGLYCWSSSNLFGSKPLGLKTLFVNCQLIFPDVDHQMMVDALELVSEDIIATKCPQASFVYLWKLSDVSAKLTTSTTRKLKINPLAKCIWSNSSQCFINFAANPYLNILLSGDELGSIWVYDLSSLICSTGNFKNCALLSPNITVPFPSLVRSNYSEIDIFLRNKKTIFNDISCSSNLQFVVVACDNNLVGIYRKC